MIKIIGGIIAQGQIKASTNNAPIWTTAAGTIGTEDEGTVVNFQFEAIDIQQGTSGLTFTKISGDFPAGLSMNSAGLLTGTASDVESNTTSNFSLRVTDSGGLFADRAFSMTIDDILPTGPELWAWGRALLGDNIGLTRSSSVQVGTLTDWASVSGGNLGEHTFAIRNNGSLYAWGYDFTNNGKLGIGSAGSFRISPIQVGSLTDWSTAESGAQHSLAVKTNGTLWSWGFNQDGQLGHSDQGGGTSRSSPVQVGGLTNWSSVNVGDSFSLAVKTDGSLWSWGKPASGQLGNGTSTGNVLSPVQVGGLTNWSIVTAGFFHSHAVKTDGTLWAWGRNSYGYAGALGLGDITNRSSPVQVGVLSDWVNVSVGRYHSVATKIDGTLWAWGRNNHGQLGFNGGSTSSPVQVGVLSDWETVSCGRVHTIALKTDDNVWAWGRNNFGQLGDETTISKSSPVQANSLSDWASIGTGDYRSFSIKNIVI